MLADGLIEAFQVQAIACRDVGSPFYADLVDRCREDLIAGSVMAQLFDGWSGHAVAEAVVLRALGAIHRRVLAGLEPTLAPFYPSVGGEPRFPEAWEAFRTVVQERMEILRPSLQRQVQTNEVKRCAALLPGFLRCAQQFRMPLRLLEIGSSAGLNLRWDAYAYELGPHRWGNPESPLIVRAEWEGPGPRLEVTPTVASRRGCDIAPVDATDPEQLLTLESFIWPDQTERIRDLRAAAQVAKRHAASLDRQPAGSWLDEQLRQAASGVATVVFHSVMWWYLSEAERDDVQRCISAAGARATAQAPLAHLQMEMLSRPECDVILQTWPGGEEMVLAHAHPHGRYVHAV
jgi:hypothetical protein